LAFPAHALVDAGIPSSIPTQLWPRRSGSGINLDLALFRYGHAQRGEWLLCTIPVKWRNEKTT